MSQEDAEEILTVDELADVLTDATDSTSTSSRIETVFESDTPR
ncbi:hypothetical protein [Halobellus ordinarius]